MTTQRTPTLPDAPLPDAARQNWVDRHAPVGLRPWLRLGRFDRPIGIWLLYLPGAMGLIFASVVNHAAFPLYLLVLFAVGSALMRAAGCAFNDFVDRDFDARVERTASRPIPAGQISPKAALGFTAACCLISFLILIQLGWLAIALGIGSLVLVAAYPFMKRITWWPQAWLGLTFNWGLLMGYAAIAHALTLGALVFYAGLVFWTIGYDTIYALQDIEDDAMIGVKSSARALGSKTKSGVAVFYALAVILTGAGAALSPLTPVFYLALVAVAVHFTAQVMRLKLGDNALALRLFKSNRQAGWLWVMGLCAGFLGADFLGPGFSGWGG